MAMTIDEATETIGTPEYREQLVYKDPLSDYDFKIDENTMYEIKVNKAFNPKYFFFKILNKLSSFFTIISALLAFALLLEYLILGKEWSDFTIYYSISTIIFFTLIVIFTKQEKKSKELNYEKILNNPSNEWEREIRRRAKVSNAIRKIKQSTKHVSTSPDDAIELFTQSFNGKDKNELDFYIYKFAYNFKANAIMITNSHVQNDVSGSGWSNVSGGRYGVTGSGYSSVKTTHTHYATVTYYQLLDKNEIVKKKRQADAKKQVEDILKKKADSNLANTNDKMKLEQNKIEKLYKSVVTFERQIKKIHDYNYYKEVEIKALKECFDDIYKALDEVNTYIELYLNEKHISIDDFIKFYKMAIGQKMKYNKTMSNEEFIDFITKKYKNIDMEIKQIKNKVKN
jgi:small-conductance mechanosensitive channel